MADRRRTLGVAGEDAVARLVRGRGLHGARPQLALPRGRARPRACARDRDRRVLRGQDPTRHRVRRAVRGGHASRSSGGSARSRCVGSPEHPEHRAPRAALRRRVGARGAGHRARDRRHRGRVLTLTRRAGSRARRSARRQHPVCQWRRSCGRAARHHDLVAQAGRRSRGRSPGSGRSSPPGTAARARPRARRCGVVRHPNTAQSTSAAHDDERDRDDRRRRCRASRAPGTGSGPCAHRSVTIGHSLGQQRPSRSRPSSRPRSSSRTATATVIGGEPGAARELVERRRLAAARREHARRVARRAPARGASHGGPRREPEREQHVGRVRAAGARRRRSARWCPRPTGCDASPASRAPGARTRARARR